MSSPSASVPGIAGVFLFRPLRLAVGLAVGLAGLVAGQAWGAGVPPSGYVTDFAIQPPAADWATLSVAGGATDTYVMDTDVNAAVTAAGVTTALAPATGAPPAAGATAVWHSTDFYVQTRPTGNRYTVLLARFVNQTGTNATALGISYGVNSPGGGVVEEADRGTRAYYSLTGQAGSWVNLEALNNVTSAAGSISYATNLALNWPTGATFYVMWADDNATGNPTDSGNQFDNFSLRVTAGVPPVTDLTLLLTAPTNGSLFVTGAPVPAAASVLNGTSPFTVQYFLSRNGGPFALASSGATAPFSVDLAAAGLGAGSYRLYGVVTDSAGEPLSTNSFTNAFVVADPIAATLTAPLDGASVDYLTPVTVVAAVAGGVPPYAVQFQLDGAAVGAPLVAPPYELNLGTLPVGDRFLRATVTDASGWSSNTPVRGVTVTGPLAVTLTPTNGATFNYGEPMELTAVGGGGTRPYQVTFQFNGQALGPFTAPPFSTNLGLLPPGAYTASALITDSATPAPHQAVSGTHTVTILPNPLLVALAGPTNGQVAYTGQGLALAAAVGVNAPVTVARVEFFLNGAPVGVDSNAPYAVTVTGPAPGIYPVHAVATDSLGRTTATGTNLVTLAIDPLANNQFTNRFNVSGTPLTIIANNTGATTETGEPTTGAGNGRGATLWWSWTAPSTGTARVDTFGSAIDTVVAVYTGGAVNALTQVAINNNAATGVPASLVTFAAQEGAAYQIQVGGATGFGTPAATGPIQLNLQMPPTVAITNPVAGAVFAAGSPIPVAVTAASPVGSVTRVDLYRAGTLVGSSASAPYSFIVSNAPAGSNLLAAVVTDQLGQVATSAVVSVLVANPGITIVSPLDGTVFATPAPITVSVFPYLASGSVTSVTFLVDGQPFATDTTAPFSGVWTNVTSGSHRLTASARDTSGILWVAPPSYLAVARTLVATNATWKYLADGSDQGSTWGAAGFNDAAWPAGPAELGYGDGDEATTVPSGPAGSYFITTYFRHAFTVTNLAAVARLGLSVMYDDGVAVYLNGVEVLRSANLPAGAAYNTLATGIGVEEALASATLAAGLLVEGTNVIAAEVHQQALDSSDVSFALQLAATPVIERNTAPVVAVVSPAPAASFVGPASLSFEAAASDPDGTVVRVEFFVDGQKIGQANAAPWTLVWNTPTLGAHVLTVQATDNGSAATLSDPVPFVVYDAAGRPAVALTAPLPGLVVQGPTNLSVAATAQAIAGVTNVQFLADGVPFASDDTAPYGATWSTEFGTRVLTAVARDGTGLAGTSAPVSVVVTIPPTNTVAPYLLTNTPAPFTVVTNLTNITVVFSERVQGVEAADLLINGAPAAAVAGSGSNYVFRFPQPAYGQIDVSWVAGHGITDFGWPANLPFDELGANARWDYTLVDRTAPTVYARTPAPSSTVTNLTQVAVTFSEEVTGVDAADLLLNGVPAFDLTGSGSNYVFLVSQPASGTINASWAADHNILDRALEPNPFNRAAVGSPWSFTLDARTVLVQSNSAWRFVRGTNEASAPADAWRQPGFDDGAWGIGPAPFVFGEPAFTNAVIPGTSLSDMASNAYSCVFLRQPFFLPNASAVTNLFLNHQSDDGFIAWINGVEVFRFNMPTGEVAFNAGARAQATEAGGTAGAAYLVATLTNVRPALVSGTNLLAVQAFNIITNPPSSDFAFNAQLYAFLSDAGLAAPRLAQALPPAGDVEALASLTVVFSEGVTNVDAADLLVNGVPAAGVASTNPTTHTFSLLQPPYGPVLVTWATNSGIVDFDIPAKPFVGASASLAYTLLNPSNPRIIAQFPPAGATVTGLTAIVVTFNEPVTGVDAADLLVNGSPATLVASTNPATYTFTLPPPAFGTVTVRWAASPGIVDLEAGLAFDPTRFGGQWNYTFINPVPAVALTSPTNGAYVLAPANLPLRATATDNDGTLARVEFLANGLPLGESTNAPYALTWSNVTAGVYTFQAVATDNSGLRGTSAPVTVSVVTNLPAFLVRGPYLQSGSPTGAVVRWRTDRAADGRVLYGTDPAALTNVAVEAAVTNEHIVRLGGLQPDTRYYYSIGGTDQRLAGTNGAGSAFWFVTAPVPGTPKPTRIWVLGDPGTAGNGSADRQNATRDSFLAYAATNGGNSDLMVMLGDNAYNSGTDTEHQRAIFDLYPTFLRNQFLWPTIGNHETAQSTTATDFPYLHIFSLPAAGESGGVPSGTEKYYSFDHGNIHFVCLDSMTSGRSATTPMAQWLQNDLAATAAEWIIVFFHHPPYTKGSHDSDAEADLIQLRQNINPILEANGVDLVLSGHSHCYERSFLLHGHYGSSATLTPSMKVNGGDGRIGGNGAYRKNAEGEGVVYTVAGNAGQATFGSLSHPAHFIGYLELGTVVIDVASNRLDMVFLGTNSTVLDRMTLTKPLPGSPAAPRQLAAAFTNQSAIRLDWIDAATNEQAYVVERSLDGAAFAGLATLPPGSVSWLDTGVSLGTTYFYRVRATNSIAFSDYSNTASATSTNAPPVPGADLAYRFAGQNLTVAVADLLANDRDPDGDVLAVTAVTPVTAQGGTATLVGGSVVYVPAPGVTQPDTFSYTVADGRGASAPGGVTVILSTNIAPQLAAVPDWVTAVLQPVVFTNTAVDADGVSFTLAPGAPAGARVHPTRGRFSWYPQRSDADTTNRITVRAVDAGVPPLAAETSFVIVVRDYVELTAGQAVLRAGETSSVPLAVTASAGLSALAVDVRFTDGRLTNLSVEPVAPALTGSALVSTGPGSARLEFTASPGAPLQGNQTLARLHFRAPAAGLPSAFVPVDLLNPSYTRAGAGLEPSAILNPGRAVLIAAEPLVDLALGTNGAPALTLFGRVGVQYTLESSTDLPPAPWTPWTQLTLTNLAQPAPLPSGPGSRLFIRARE
ncbi:MAG: hypothetical protein RJA22_34 [Verrucomicrobiota bacterium]